MATFRKMIERLPKIASLAELKPGDALIISGVTSGVEKDRLTATNIIAGVEPILQSAPSRQGGQATGGDWGTRRDERASISAFFKFPSNMNTDFMNYRVLRVLFAAILFLSVVSAQDSTGNQPSARRPNPAGGVLRGTVKDGTGGVIPEQESL